ncbi:hypothetical protein [Motiliproteus sp. SC1-56]|uniref:hypothetical protein n=1 Tax=Motiliproteus sp. SC1-56 TaxID=2799565 RepID=UPI001A8E9470|nr:hypothetical protein [Motiliproteus sp. SC1-56]
MTNKPMESGRRARELFDYCNKGWPRDFDIRIEVAEQREVLLASSEIGIRAMNHASGEGDSLEATA